MHEVGLRPNEMPQVGGGGSRSNLTAHENRLCLPTPLNRVEMLEESKGFIWGGADSVTAYCWMWLRETLPGKLQPEGVLNSRLKTSNMLSLSPAGMILARLIKILHSTALI